LEGQIAFVAEKQTTALDEGKMVALHAGIPHSVTAVKESVFLLTINTKPAPL
jgi:quercetin dioxygenase-like cupin family protein